MNQNPWLVLACQTVDVAEKSGQHAQRTPIPASCSARGASPPGANTVAWREPGGGVGTAARALANVARERAWRRMAQRRRC